MTRIVTDFRQRVGRVNGVIDGLVVIGILIAVGHGVGRTSLVDRPSRAHRIPGRTPASSEQQVLA